MRFGCTLLSVRDIGRSVRFYEAVLGLRVENDFGANVTLTGGISLQTDNSWRCLTGKDDISYGGNDAELYFEETDFDVFVKRLTDAPGIEYVHPVVEHRWGQRVVRIYDPDRHIIEIGEDIRSVCRRFLGLGMNAVQISERMEVPLKYVRSCMAADTMETDRLLLRPWRESDAEQLYELASDPEIGPRAGWEPHEDAGQSLFVIRNVLSKPGTFAMVEKGTERIIGCISFMTSETTFPLDEADAEIGFWIGRRYWNMGFATEASRRILDYAFLDQGCERVWCACLESNVACIRVQEKLGFLYRRSEDVHNTAFGTRCHRLSYISDDRWRLLSGRHRS